VAGDLFRPGVLFGGACDRAAGVVCVTKDRAAVAATCEASMKKQIVSIKVEVFNTDPPNEMLEFDHLGDFLAWLFTE